MLNSNSTGGSVISAGGATGTNGRIRGNSIALSFVSSFLFACVAPFIFGRLRGSNVAGALPVGSSHGLYSLILHSFCSECWPCRSNTYVLLLFVNSFYKKLLRILIKSVICLMKTVMV